MIDFGTDLNAPTPFDIDPYFAFVTGPEGLGQALARRLTTPRGALEGVPGYGYDVRAHLNDHAPDVGALQVAIAEELAKDERVQRAVAVVTFASDASTLSIVADVLTAAGPFRLVLDVSAVSATLLAFEAT